MQKILLPFLLLLPLALPVLGAGAPAAERSLQAARDKVYPALVNITVVWQSGEGGRMARNVYGGSGTILDAEGHVLTNYHVAGLGRKIVCTLSDKQEIPADLVGADPKTDLAVLKLRLSERKDPSAPVPTASFGDSDALEVGDSVLAMGSPQGLARSVTLGIISNKERYLPPGWAGALEGEPIGLLTRFLQHDAMIFHGNSGGPLVNFKGEVIGVNELGQQGVAFFAIPSNTARKVFEEIVRSGRVRRAWLGLQLQTLLKGSAEERGVLVGSVEPGSPAEQAGFKAGDLLVSFDGTSVTARFPEEIPLVYQRIAQTPVGKTVEMAYRRDGALQTTKASLGEEEPALGQEKELRRLGLTARALTRPMVRSMQLSDASGALLSGVQAGGAAGRAKPPLQAGDVLKTLEGKPVSSLQDLLAWEGGVKPDEKRTVVAEVERGSARVLSVVVVEPRQEDPQGRQIPKAWLGCSTQVLTKPLAGALSLEGTRGVRVTQVYPETPAEKAGIRVGDIIVQVGEKPVQVTLEGDSEVFPEMIRQRRIGEEVTFRILRDGKDAELPVTLSASPVEPKDLKKFRDPDFEFVVREIAFEDRVRNRWDKSVTGCVVEGVERSGWAGFGGLSPGDLLLKLDGKDVPDAAALKKTLEDLKQRKPSRVTAMIRRGVGTGYLSIEPQWEH